MKISLFLEQQAAPKQRSPVCWGGAGIPPGLLPAVCPREGSQTAGPRVLGSENLPSWLLLLPFSALPAAPPHPTYPPGGFFSTEALKISQRNIGLDWILAFYLLWPQFPHL